MRIWICLGIAGCAPHSDPSVARKPAGEETADPTTETLPTTDTSTEAVGATNILLVLLDDVGVDNVGVYAVAPEPPPTPVIDGLAAEGVLFRWAYASPMCSPTRANLVTGRHARRTGVGHLIKSLMSFELDRAEIGLGELVAASPHGYTSSLAGKWHLSPAGGEGALDHPVAMGFDWHAGSLENLDVSATSISDKGYANWEKNDNGVLFQTDVYATTDTTDDAIVRMAEMPEPWLMFVSYNAAHSPWHVPPEELFTLDLGDAPTDDLRYDAMVESVDTEIGRILHAMDDEVRARTTVIIMGDNGTPDQVITPPFDPAREKGTVYEGGVRVPLIVAGPHVETPGLETDAIVHAVDVFATVAEIAGVPLEGAGAPAFLGPIDGISFLPAVVDPAAPSARAYAFAETFEPIGVVENPETESLMMHDKEWKLIRQRNELTIRDKLFRFEPGAIDEGEDLLAEGVDALEPDALKAYERLGAELDAHMAALTSG